MITSEITFIFINMDIYDVLLMYCKYVYPRKVRSTKHLRFFPSIIFAGKGSVSLVHVTFIATLPIEVLKTNE